MLHLVQLLSFADVILVFVFALLPLPQAPVHSTQCRQILDVIERLRKRRPARFRKCERECGCAEAEEREADERQTWVELALESDMDALRDLNESTHVRVQMHVSALTRSTARGASMEPTRAKKEDTLRPMARTLVG